MLKLIGIISLSVAISMVLCGNDTESVQRLPIDGDRERYVECSCRVQKCGAGDIFDDGQCLSSNVTTTPPPECKDREIRDVPGQDDQFQICKNGRWVTSTCPEGTKFDKNVKACA